MKIMSELLNTVKKVFANQMPTPKASAAFSAQLAGLDAPGVTKGEIIQPVPVTPTSAPGADVEQTARICSACGQRLPEPVAPPIPAGPSPLDAEWNDLERTDLPPRSPNQIQLLIAAGETADARTKRIFNDHCRYAARRDAGY